MLNYRLFLIFDTNLFITAMIDTVKKLKFRDAATIINAPADLALEFDKLGFPNTFAGKPGTNTLVFIYNKAEFLDFLNNQLSNIVPDSVLWFAYPKGTSKIKTDIHRDIVRETGESFNITTVTAVSINDTWSALRFRPIDRVGK